MNCFKTSEEMVEFLNSLSPEMAYGDKYGQILWNEKVYYPTHLAIAPVEAYSKVGIPDHHGLDISQKCREMLPPRIPGRTYLLRIPTQQPMVSHTQTNSSSSYSSTGGAVFAWRAFIHHIAQWTGLLSSPQACNKAKDE